MDDLDDYSLPKLNEINTVEEIADHKRQIQAEFDNLSVRERMHPDGNTLSHQTRRPRVLGFKTTGGKVKRTRKRVNRSKKVIRKRVIRKKTIRKKWK
jgi:hypothetical protein